MLNRERVAAALSLLVLVFGLYGMFSSRWAASPPPVDTEPPVSSTPVPPVEPRLLTEEGGGGRNPFLVSSDWRPITPEELPPPAFEPYRFLVVPPGLTGDPSDVDFRLLRDPLTPPREEGKNAGTKGDAVKEGKKNE